MLRIISQFNKLSVVPTIYRSVSTSSVLSFKVTSALLAEPLKKKKRIDPAIVRAREDRKKKKIEKQIRKLEKVARQLKPIEECDVPLDIMDSLKQRQRRVPKLTESEEEERIQLQKEWSKYKHRQYVTDMQMIDRIILSQQKALDELRLESEELYQEAIQNDLSLLPFISEGPSDSPVIENYEAPDGDYQDVSRKWN